MKNTLLIHYFLMNLRFFPMGFLCVLKIYCVRLFIVEKIGCGTAPKKCGIHFKSQPLLQKTYLSYTFETLAAYIRMCLRMYALARIRKPRLTYVGRGPFWSFNFLKIDFCSFKRLYFSI